MLRLLALLFVLALSCTFENTIVDDASLPPSVGFEFKESGADELTGALVVSVVLSRPADAPATVDYSLLAGTALATTDFELKAGTLMFDVGEYTKDITVNIVRDNDETESAEEFNIALSSPTGAMLDETRAIHTVKISDHILPRVTVGPNATMSSEAAPSQLVIRLDRPSEGQSMVVVGVTGGAPFAANTGDYTIVNDTVVVIPDQATMVTVPIGEKNDMLDEEDNEVVVFTLKNASPNLVIGTSRMMNHMISDDDLPPVVRFSNATGSVPENQILGTTLVNVTLSAPSGRQVRVTYTRNGADSADDQDATVQGSGNQITFNAGDTNRQIIVSINNDNVDEDNEDVIINLSSPVNATLMTNMTHTLTINDNDTALVRFAASSQTVDEDDSGGTDVSVILTTPCARTITVNFSVSSSQADSNDYSVNTSSPLSFSPGTTSRNITVDIPDNTPAAEGNENVVFTLGSVTGTTGTTSPTTHTLTITE